MLVLIRTLKPLPKTNVSLVNWQSDGMFWNILISCASSNSILYLEKCSWSPIYSQQANVCSTLQLTSTRRDGTLSLSTSFIYSDQLHLSTLHSQEKLPKKSIQNIWEIRRPSHLKATGGWYNVWLGDVPWVQISELHSQLYHRPS